MLRKMEHNNVAHFKTGQWGANLTEAIADYVDSRKHESYWQLTIGERKPLTASQVYHAIVGQVKADLLALGLDSQSQQVVTTDAKEFGRGRETNTNEQQT